MKIDFAKPILGIVGTPIKVKDKEGEPDFTLRDVSVNALLAETPEAARLEGGEKVKRFRLADKIFGCQEPIVLPAEDIVLLKNLIARVYGTLTTARAWDILDGEIPPPPPTPDK